MVAERCDGRSIDADDVGAGRHGLARGVVRVHIPSQEHRVDLPQPELVQQHFASGSGDDARIVHAERREDALADGIFAVAMTLLGLGAFPASHPLNIGMMGMHGESWVNHAIQEADLLLAFGMRFDDRVTGNLKTYAPNARKIHIDIDPSEVNKNIKVDVAIVGDLRETLRDLLDILEPAKHGQWLKYIASMKGDTAVRDIQSLPDNGHLYAAHVINDIWRITEGKAVVVTDVGQHQMWEAQYYHHESPRSLITSGGLGTMALLNGLGRLVPGSISDKLGRKNTVILMFCEYLVAFLLLLPNADTFTKWLVGICIVGFSLWQKRSWGESTT